MSNVKLNIKEVAEGRSVANPFQLSKGANLSYALCYRLWHEQTTQISLPTLAKVCDALSCEPGDLLVRASGKKKTHRK
jgi:DNA-binding Xre family transcriptional regulator